MGLVSAFLIDTGLLLLPMLGCALLAARFGVSNWLLLLIAAVAGSGALSLAVFWVYLLSAHLGREFSLAVTGLSALVLLDACRHRFAGWRALRPLLPMGALYITAAFFDSALAYLHVAFASNTNIAPERFQVGLPADNILPLLFAKQLQTSVRPLPPLLVRGWQSSDRPPLQTGYYLMQQSVLHTDHFNDYQLLAMLLQCLWIPGLWALLVAMGKPRAAIGLSLTAVVFNGFIFQNSIFTWPKLIAAASVLLVAAILFTRQAERLMVSRTAGVMVGLAAGAAMMSHPGSAYAMIGMIGVIAVLWLLPRFRPSWWRPPKWRFIWPAAVAAAVSYEPWSAFYQKHYQPPANALTELQFAGRNGPVPHKTTTQVIVEAYQKAGVKGTIGNKASNFATPFDHLLDYPRWCVMAVYNSLTGHPASAAKDAAQIVGVQFFYIGTILGVTCLGLAVLYGRALWELGQRMRGGRTLPSRASSYSQEYVMLAVIAICWIVWCLLEFGPASTIAHQGTYFVEPVLISLGVIGLWSVSHRLTAVLVIVPAAFTVWLYACFTPEHTHTNFVWDYNPRDPFTLGSLGIKSILTGGSNTDPATTGAMALLLISLALCAAALWWVTVDLPAPGEDELGARSGDSDVPLTRRLRERPRHAVSKRYVPDPA